MTNLEKLTLVSNYYKIIPKEFDPFYHKIKEKGDKLGLNIQFVEITSDFGIRKSKIEKRYGIEITVLSTAEKIDQNLYRQMAKKVGCDKTNSNLTLCLGYGLRNINEGFIAGSESGSIVLGSRCFSNNQIMFDIMAHRFLGREAILYRLGHEMLHEFGYSEEEVKRMQEKYYKDIKDLENPTIDSLFQKLEDAEMELRRAIDIIFEEGSEEYQLLEKTMQALKEKGVDFKFSKMTICVKNPATKQWTKMPLIGSTNEYFMRLIESAIETHLTGRNIT